MPDRELRTILLVDSSASIVFYIAMLLRRLEYKVVTARSGEDAAGDGRHHGVVRRAEWAHRQRGNGTGLRVHELAKELEVIRRLRDAGATEVTIVSLENFEEMPVLRTTQGHEEFEEARREGIRFVTRRGPARFGGDGRLAHVDLRAVRSVFDANGRFAPEYDDNDVIAIEADSCVLAIGQRPDLSFLSAEDGVALTPGGTIKVDPRTLATTAPGVFAGGDVAFGPRNLIEAVANGKRAARSIHRYLSGQAARTESIMRVEKIPTRDYRMIAGFELLDREAPPTVDLGRSV